VCKYCDNLEYRSIKIPNRANTADDNVCEIASPEIVEIDGEKYNAGSKCEGCYGCTDENSYWYITTWEDIISLNYYHKVRDLIIAPCSCRFAINFCPMCGKRILEKIHGELIFW